MMLIRIIVMFVSFALLGGLSPEWLKWGMLGAVLVMLAIKIEDKAKEK